MGQVPAKSGEGRRSGGRVPGSKGIQIALLVALVVFSAGCMGLASDDSSGSPTASVDSVPADANAVMYVDGDIVTDQATTELVNGMIGIYTGTPEDAEPMLTWEEALDKFENEVGFNIGDFNSAMAYSQVEDPESEDSEMGYAGIIVETDWTWEELSGAGDSVNAIFEQDTYNGVTVYTNGSSEDEVWVADFGDGTFVFGSEEAVKDAIDIDNGDADPLGGELKEAYEDAADGLMKVAMEAPEELENSTVESVESRDVPEITAFTSSYATDGSELQTTGQWITDSEENATKMAELMRQSIEETYERNPMAEKMYGEYEINVDGNAVTTRSTTTTDKILDGFEMFRSWFQSESDGPSQSIGM